MTSPAVTELPRRLEPVSRDTFLDEERLDHERSPAQIVDRVGNGQVFARTRFDDAVGRRRAMVVD